MEEVRRRQGAVTFYLAVNNKQSGTFASGQRGIPHGDMAQQRENGHTAGVQGKSTGSSPQKKVLNFRI